MGQRQLSNVEQLRIFLSVAEQGSFSAAGRRLSITQPGVSKQVKALEAHFGVALLVRTTRRSKLSLTAAGSTLYESAREILACIDRAEVLMREHREGYVGHLSIGAGLAFGSYRLPQIVASFRRRAPGATLRLEVVHSRDLNVRMEAGDFDFGVGSGPDRPKGVLIEDLCAVRWTLFVARQHPLLAHPSIQPSDLEPYTFAIGMLDSPSWHARILMLDQNRIRPRQFIETGSPEATKRIVAAGTEIGMLPPETIEREVASGELVPLLLGTRFETRLELYRRPDKFQTPLMTAFALFLKHALTQRTQDIASDTASPAGIRTQFQDDGPARLSGN